MKEKLNHKMRIKSETLADGKYLVEGVIIYADTMAEAIRKWCRAKKECE